MLRSRRRRSIIRSIFLSLLIGGLFQAAPVRAESISQGSGQRWISVTHRILYCGGSSLCPAALGFTVQRDGRYSVSEGIAPVGTLLPQELEDLVRAADRVAAENLSGAPTCIAFTPHSDQPVYELTIKLIDGSAIVVDSVQMTSSSGSSCYRGGEKTADALRLEVIALAMKYDPGSPPRIPGTISSPAGADSAS